MRGLMVEWPMVSLVALSEVAGSNDTSARTRIIKIYGLMEFSSPADAAGVSTIGSAALYFDG